jgi:hypothetical protein
MDFHVRGNHWTWFFLNFPEVSRCPQENPVQGSTWGLSGESFVQGAHTWREFALILRNQLFASELAKFDVLSPKHDCSKLHSFAGRF